jgi:hypothetical protein
LLLRKKNYYRIMGSCRDVDRIKNARIKTSRKKSFAAPHRLSLDRACSNICYLFLYVKQAAPLSKISQPTDPNPLKGPEKFALMGARTNPSI